MMICLIKNKNASTRSFNSFQVLMLPTVKFDMLYLRMCICVLYMLRDATTGCNSI